MPKSNKTGWERENRVVFDDIVIKYDKVRWDYPIELFSDVIKYASVFEHAGLRKSGKAIEIGAGTGKATKPFLDAGYDVTAVELGVNMTEFLHKRYGSYPNFNVLTSTFEEVTLEENNYDLIYAASAFHWVDADVGCPKVFNLLKSGGVFALFRSNWDPSGNDELEKDVQAVYDKHYYNHYDPKERPRKTTKMTQEELWEPSMIFKGFRFYDMEQYGFTDIKKMFYSASRAYNADDYIELLDTLSDHRSLPDENRKALYRGVKDEIIKHGGKYELNNLYQLYMGRKP